jgi:hypothetical protein
MRICEVITALPHIEPLSGDLFRQHQQQTKSQRLQQARQREQAAKKQQRLQRQQDAAWRRRHQKTVQGAAKWRIKPHRSTLARKSLASTGQA